MSAATGMQARDIGSAGRDQQRLDPQIICGALGAWAGSILNDLRHGLRDGAAERAIHDAREGDHDRRGLVHLANPVEIVTGSAALQRFQCQLQPRKLIQGLFDV